VIAEASITGLFKTVLIIVGAFVLLRFLGQLMIVKRNMEEERKMNERQRKTESERIDKLKNFGKVNISGRKNTKERMSKADDNVQDVDFEEVE
jgi:hypothetical protein